MYEFKTQRRIEFAGAREVGACDGGGELVGDGRQGLGRVALGQGLHHGRAVVAPLAHLGLERDLPQQLCLGELRDGLAAALAEQAVLVAGIVGAVFRYLFLVDLP